MTKCSLFCILWVGTNYMYILSLKILLATDVMALFATNVSFVYILSWVILHEQFVGIRVSKARLLIFTCCSMLSTLTDYGCDNLRHWSRLTSVYGRYYRKSNPAWGCFSYFSCCRFWSL